MEKGAPMADDAMRGGVHSVAAGHGGTHHVPVRVLAATLAALLVLTFITVGVTWVAWLDFGNKVNLWIALTIATIKGTLVALYFMHLRYEKPFNAVIFLCALLFVMLFCGLALMDSLAYAPAIQEYRDADPAHYAPALPPQTAPSSPPRH